MWLIWIFVAVAVTSGAAFAFAPVWVAVMAVGLVFGLGFALRRSVSQARGALKDVRAQRNAAKRGLAQHAVDGGHAARTAAAGQRAGTGLGVVVGPLELVARALWSGLRNGWSEGRSRSKGWLRNRLPNLAPPPDTPTPPGPQPNAAPPTSVPPATAQPGGGHCQHISEEPELAVCGKPTLPGSKYCAEHHVAGAGILRPAGGDTPQPTQPGTVPGGGERKPTMAIETRTGGEVLTREQFEQEMKAVIAETTAELEDAQGDAQRAVQDTSRVELMAASMHSMEIDAATVTAVRMLADTNTARRQNAEARVSAAEQRKTAAEKALATFHNAPQTKFHAS